MNGNLKYYYLNHPYDICIGSSSVVSGGEWEPRENENVSIVENICKVNNSCKLNYVYEKKFNDGDHLTINCSESCSDWVIDVRSADFGVLMKDSGPDSKPYRISLTKKDCLSSSALNVVKTDCDDKSHCHFPIRKSDFLLSPNQCGESLKLLVRYTCKIQVL
ncbi:uncharacterized protein LOC124452152 [Xenia sp. Carnegie-2017]|uniref:uncharacterized protein LOC124452152 n=1 Tax=Xenia sp. Carnegie-2017 TaxID=2897299 RepID=UPI001F04E9A3|nr:uncharacterized protein LOC124452152 [Xenia sp. Carnegie-2017]